MMNGALPPTFVVRPATAGDDERVAEFAHRLSRQTLRLRFMAATAEEAAAAELQREVRCTEPAGESFVAETPDGQAIGHAFAARTGRDEAEVAFVIADPWQHHGVGTALFAALLERMRAEGIRVISAETLGDNLAMIRLLRHTGLPALEERHGETVHVRLQLS